MAVPLVLGLGTLASYGAGLQIERLGNWLNDRWKLRLETLQVRHICFVGSVFLFFNVFFIFAGRSNFRLLPSWVELVFNSLVILISTLWLQRNFHRSQLLYRRESLTGSLRQNLEELLLDLIRSGGSIEQALQQKRAKIESMRQEYSVTNEEQEQVLLALFHPEGTLLETSAKLLANLRLWTTRYRMIVEHAQRLPAALYRILRSTIDEQQRLIVTEKMGYKPPPFRGTFYVKMQPGLIHNPRRTVEAPVG